jgi:hypothetical protein
VRSRARSPVRAITTICMCVCSAASSRTAIVCVGQWGGARRADADRQSGDCMHAGLFADSPVQAADTPQGLSALLSGNLSLTKPTTPWCTFACLCD